MLASKTPPSAAFADPATDAPGLPLAPILRLRRPSVPAPDWQLYAQVVGFLLDARSPSDLAHRAAASLGLLPQVAWTDLEGDPAPDAHSLAIPLEHVGTDPSRSGERRWFAVGLEAPADANARMLVTSLLDIVGKLHAREVEAQRMADAAYRDVLTGLWNRRGFTTLCDQALAARNRTETPIALMVIDLDHFKSINDQLGHAMGDLALQHVARTAERVIRPADVAARVGGDELVILLGAADGEGARRVADRLRTLLRADNPIAPHPLTLSIGIADQRCLETPPDGEKHDGEAPPLQAANTASIVDQRAELFAAADRALYRAKARGRDQACVASSSEGA